MQYDENLQADARKIFQVCSAWYCLNYLAHIQLKICPSSMRIFFASLPYSARSACVHVTIVCNPSMRDTSFFRRSVSSSLITSSKINTGYSPATSLKISTSASFKESAAVRVCPCDAYPRASLPEITNVTSSRCGPTVVYPSRLSFSYAFCSRFFSRAAISLSSPAYV